MNERNLRVLEFPKIRARMAALATTEMGRACALELTPSSDPFLVRRMQQQTEEASTVLAYNGSNPMAAFTDVRPFLKLAQIGSTLSAKAILQIADAMKASRLVRSALVTRALTDQERLIVESHRLSVKQALVAYDAFALIVNKANSDTLISVDELRDIVSGRITRWEQLKCGTRHGELKLVFDQSGSSTVRYMRDSLLLGGELKGNIYAQGGNRDVIETVKQDPEVIGVVGTNWLKERRQPSKSVK